MSDPGDRLLTSAETAERLRVNVDTLRRWRREGTGPPWHRVGRQVRYPARELERWLQQEGRGS
jgi:excisionase family DNA binding protein